jgi:hypothetical protein
MERSRPTFIYALPAAGALYLTGVLVRGPFAAPGLGAGPFVERATSSFYGVAYLLVTAAAALSVLGYLALRELLPGSLARAGATLAIVGLVFLVPLFGVSGVAYPALGRAYVAGDHAVVAAAADAFDSFPVKILFAVTALGWVGHVLLAVVLWRTPWVSKLAVVPFAVATVLMCLPTVYAIEIAGCALFLVAGAILARAVARREVPALMATA